MWSRRSFWGGFLALVFQLSLFGSESLQSLLQEIPAEFEAISFSKNQEHSLVSNSKSEFVSNEWMQSDRPGFGEFLRVDVQKELTNAWDANVQSHRNSMRIAKGEWVLASFYVRSARPLKTALFKGMIERSSPEWEGIASVGGTVGNSWTRYITFGKAHRDYAPGSVKLSLHLANGIQSLDIAGCAIVKLNAGTDPERLPTSRLNYPGIAEDAPWRAKAAEMIAENRQGTLRLEVVDGEGLPLAGVRVEVRQLEHAYAFGSFFDRSGSFDEPGEEQYNRWFLGNFNHATTPIYWADWGWADPKKRERMESIAKWLQDQGMPTRAHVLLYPGWDFAPKELRDLAGDPVAFQARIIRHIEEIVPIMQAYGVHEYDVTNELRQLKDVTNIVGFQGVVEWFQKVRELDPESVLYINENTILSDGASNKAAQDHYFSAIETLISMGAPIDGIGMQGHMGEAASGAEQMWAVLDRFATFGLPIRITEYDLDTRDQLGQARYDSDFYTAMFAHPATVGVTRWGFYESEMWLPNGAFINAAGEYKPNGIAYRKLLFETWNSDASLVCDEVGRSELEAFYGRYKIRVGNDDGAFEQIISFDAESLSPIKIVVE